MRAGPRLPEGPARAAARSVRPLLSSARVPVTTQRRLIDALTAGIRPPRGTKVKGATYGGVSGERIQPPGARDDGVLLYLHGGGYTVGSPRSHRGLAAAIAAELELPAFVPAYRLAPEHPHPAALDDALAAYRGLLTEGVAPERIAVAGDSAGGGLALALALRLRDRQEPLPAVIGMLCPWLDLTPDLADKRPPAPREPLLTRAALTRWAAGYSNGNGDAGDPSVSPLLGELPGLPPLVLDYAGDDPLASDADKLVARAGEAGGDLEHRRHDGLWHGFHSLTGALAAADEAVEGFAGRLRARLAPSRPPPRVGIVGAGMSGLCMAARLRQAGFHDFAVYEKGETLGGTWRENTYPGLTCDVPSRFYSYSFAPNPSWTHAYAPGEEIQAYFTGVAQRLGLERFIRCRSEVTSARWQKGRWRIRTSDGHQDSVDVLVAATGVLHHPKIPEIEGLESFNGAAFHSARWDHSVRLEGRRVAVIGTGSTGVQIATELARRVDRLMVFQRTAQWILPVTNRPYSRLGRRLFERFPALNRLSYRGYQRLLETILGEAVVRPGWQRSLINLLCRLNLRFTVRDPELRRRLTPEYEPMCKRLVMSGGFYRAMQQPGVELVTQQIERIEPRGLVTRDGRLHEADVIVFATGFDAHAYMRPMELVGENGLTIDQAWAEQPRAYRTVAVPGFPNFFTLMGPHSPIGNQSLISVAEAQSEYVLRWIKRLARGTIASVAPTAEATRHFNEQLRAAAPTTIWATGCSSWYLDGNGVPEVWPWTPQRHRELLAEPEVGDFAITSTGRASPARTPAPPD